MNPRSVRICIVGSLTGLMANGVPTQGETLADLFVESGYAVVRTSARPNQILRMIDILETLIRCRNQIDVQLLQVYSGRSFILADLASRAAQILNIPIVMILHGGALPQFSRKHPTWARQVLGRATRLVAPSKYLARELNWVGYPIQVIPNVINIRDFPFRLRSKLHPKLFWMRAFYWFYHPELALRTAARLKLNQPDVRLTMAGPDMGLLEKNRALAAELGLEKSVSFPGLLDLKTKTNLAQQHDIFLHTNHIDNMPLSILEMAAMGLPIVATNVGGIPDLLEDEVTGLLVPEGDFEAMCAAIKRLLTDVHLAARLSQNGRQLAESYSWVNVQPQWEELFRSCLPALQVKQVDDFLSMNMDHKIRLLQIQDVAALVEIHCLSFPESRSTRLGKRYVKKMFFWFLENQPQLSMAAEKNGEICGYVVGAVGGYGRKIFRYAVIEIVFSLLIHPKLWLRRDTFALWKSYLQAFNPALLWNEKVGQTRLEVNIPLRGALAGIGVLPSARNSGIGKLLVQAFEKAAKDKGVELLGLSVEIDNYAARQLYESNGWRLDTLEPDLNSAHYSKVIN